MSVYNISLKYFIKPRLCLRPGEVVAFLDAHCECTEGWLEPLLEEISNHPKNVAIPVTDDIDPNTFK